MPIIDPLAAQKLQPELLPSESIYWAAMPNPRVIFHSDDWATIPLSLLFTAFSIFWEAAVLGYWDRGPRHIPPSTFMVIWGIPFIVVSQYMLWGRFLVDAWLKRRTYYAVTNRRVLILQEGWKRKTNFLFLESLPQLTREGGAIGTLWLGPKYPAFAGRGRPSRGMTRFYLGSGVPVLADIDDVDYVQRLILDLREKSRTPPPAS